MYQPRQFVVNDTADLHAAMRAYPLGSLITFQDGELVADEIPFLLDPTPSAEHPNGVLKAHVARANPLWQKHDASKQVLVIFKGPQAYVSPSWYATKAEHGKVVPTCNYIVVQASVLDLGCAPGSWLQYARGRIGERGAMVGIDRVAIPGVPGARLLVGDVFTVVPADLLGTLDHFDVVMSDIAPDTTGVRHMDQSRSEALFERALELACATLAPGGRFVSKIFQGPDFQKLIAACRARFATVKVMKPASSRQISIEQYITAAGFPGVTPGAP